MAQMILVTSGRGGAGKSAVCAYLGAALSACGKTVLIIEASRRSLDVFLGVQERVVFDLADALAHRCELGEATITCENGVRLICGPVAGGAPKLGEWACAQLRGALDGHFDFILAEMDGSDPALAALAACADRAVIVCAADRVSTRDSRSVSDALAAAGMQDIRLCINMLTREFARERPVPDLDWMIDNVCAQLIAVVPFDGALVTPVPMEKNTNLANLTKIIFDNFAQRIMGNYIDLELQ